VGDSVLYGRVLGNVARQRVFLSIATPDWPFLVARISMLYTHYKSVYHIMHHSTHKRAICSNV